MPRWAYALAAAAEITALWVLSAQPGDGFLSELPGPSGNFGHVVANSVLAFLLLRALVGARGRGLSPGEAWPGLRTRTGAAIAVFITLWAVIDEAHQFWVPGRVCSVLDVLADILGGLLVLVWPGSGPGRPRGWVTALVVLSGAIAVAIYGWCARFPLDRLFHTILERIWG